MGEAEAGESENSEKSEARVEPSFGGAPMPGAS